MPSADDLQCRAQYEATPYIQLTPTISIEKSLVNNNNYRPAYATPKGCIFPNTLNGLLSITLKNQEKKQLLVAVAHRERARPFVKSINYTALVEIPGTTLKAMPGTFLNHGILNVFVDDVRDVEHPVFIMCTVAQGDRPTNLNSLAYDVQHLPHGYCSTDFQTKTLNIKIEFPSTDLPDAKDLYTATIEKLTKSLKHVNAQAK